MCSLNIVLGSLKIYILLTNIRSDKFVLSVVVLETGDFDASSTGVIGSVIFSSEFVGEVSVFDLSKRIICNVNTRV